MRTTTDSTCYFTVTTKQMIINAYKAYMQIVDRPLNKAYKNPSIAKWQAWEWIRQYITYPKVVGVNCHTFTAGGYIYHNGKMHFAYITANNNYICPLDYINAHVTPQDVMTYNRHK